MTIAQPYDKYFRLAPETELSAEDGRMVAAFNAAAARAAQTSLDDLPAMPVRRWESYPYALPAENNGLTMACADMPTLVKAAARATGVSPCLS